MKLLSCVDALLRKPHAAGALYIEGRLPVKRILLASASTVALDWIIYNVSARLRHDKRSGLMQRFAGRVAIVVGSGSGIGEATAKRLASEGASVAVADVNDGGAERVAAEIRDAGGLAVAEHVDIGDEALVASAIDRVADRWGRIDVLHNNAADLRPEILGQDGMVDELEIDLFMHVLRINLAGVMLACKHVLPRMLEQGGGAIVNTSSQIAVGAAAAGQPAYGCSKAGVESLTRAVAGQYGKRGIRCNAIAPGLTVTENMRRVIPPELLDGVLPAVAVPALGTPENQAAAVAFLASDDAAYINGETIYVGGGERALLPTAVLETQLRKQGVGGIDQPPALGRD
jgi:NAD(P)-dependent dehydrogenase (short-subunit alcohol dehydrogenase family)